jgi:hypothetical protein
MTPAAPSRRTAVRTASTSPPPPAPSFWRDEDDALLASARRLAALLERRRALLAMGDAQEALWVLREAHEEIRGLCDLAFGG